MKKLFNTLGTITMLAALLLSFAACDDLFGKTPTEYEPKVYHCSNSDGTDYILAITRTDKAAVQFTPAAGDSYTLTISMASGTKKSTGTVKSFSNDTFTLTHSSGASATFDVTVSGIVITSITSSGTTIPVDGGTVPTPGVLKPANAIVPVTGISGVPSGALVNTPITLTGIVAPDNATNKTIVWTVKSGTGATISGNTLSTTSAGTVTVTATIAKGKDATTDYTQDFSIVIASTFVAVTGISGVPSGGLVNTPITLSGIVAPDNATNKTIVWSVKSGTGATISGNTLSATSAGTVTVTGTIANGQTATTPYTQDFTIAIASTFVAVTGITGVPTNGTAGATITLTGTVAPDNATNKTIVWSVKSAGTTGATISGNILSTTSAGTVTVTATIANGQTATTAYTQDFSIGIASGGTNQTFTTVDAFETWLSAQPENTPPTAYNVALNINTSSWESGSYRLRSALKNNDNIYVNLDFSGSTFTEIKNITSCTTLTGITIPKSVTNVNPGAFSDCTNLTAVNVASGNNNYISDSGVLYNKGKTTLICYPGGKTGSFDIPNSVTSIGEGAFAGCTKLTAINVASGNTKFFADDGVLYDYEKTTLICYPGGKTGSTFGIPNTVKSIGFAAFYGCTALTNVTIPNSVTSIGDGAFYGCTGLTGVTIGNSVKTIGEYAFSGCIKLTDVTIPDSVTGIEEGAFSGCTVLTGVTIGNSVKTIGNRVFSGCTALTNVTIPNSVTTIGQGAFSGCTALTNVTIPNSVTTIGQGAFYGCTDLTSVTIGNSVKNIGEFAFYGCTKLTGVIIPDSVTTIEQGAFYGCTGLTDVTIGNSVTNIGNYAFSGCSKLTTVTFNGSTITSFSENAFPGNLRTKYLAEGIGTYIRTNNSETWTREDD